MAHEAISGERLTSESRSTPTAEAGRVCAEAGCGTRLSIYNDLEFCARHQPMIVPRMRGRVLGD